MKLAWRLAQKPFNHQQVTEMAVRMAMANMQPGEITWLCLLNTRLSFDSDLQLSLSFVERVRENYREIVK